MALLLAAAAATAPVPAAAQDRPVTPRLTSNRPPKAPWALQIERIIAKVAEETPVTVKIEALYGGQLGNEQDTMQQVARGRIDAGMFAIGAAALVVPRVQLSILPFYFSSFAEQDCMLDRHLYKPLDAAFAAKGVKLLGLADIGTIDVIGKRPHPTRGDTPRGNDVILGACPRRSAAMIGDGGAPGLHGGLGQSRGAQPAVPAPRAVDG
jgi:TRAP-type C4-dicarboxylate transport system substrate-binding protein